MNRLIATNRILRALAATALVAAASTFAPAPASAHFILKAPASWAEQNAFGNPQKLGPCGDDGAAPTGEVTAFQPGQTIDIVIEETIFHPGHYRIALSTNDRSELPAEPVVTPAGTPCGSVDIQDPPVFPVLADGVLLHTSSFDGPQTVQVKLPEISCDHCTLQIIEFMSNHGLNDPGGCFYHHCADISIGADGSGGTGGDGNGNGGAGAGAGGAGAGGAGGEGGNGGNGGAGSSSDGCGCSVPGSGGETPAGAALLGVAIVAMFRRRRR